MSALVGKTYTLGNLITFDENGISIAPFVDIKKTLITRMRQIYGADIDVSDASADGQWITEIALIINNCMLALSELYADLDPSVAQGKALDMLASFSNITRYPATASICLITITAPAGTTTYTLYGKTKFVDKNGQSWSIDTTRSYYLPAVNVNGDYVYDFSKNNNIMTVPLVCDVTGPVSIPANSIDGFANIDSANANLVVTQTDAGIKGAIAESDAHLRARRNHSAANEALTIADGIRGILLTNVNIIDAKVINHLTDVYAGDPAVKVVDAHSVEVLVKRRYPYKGTTNDNDSLDEFIAKTIYARLTPGIPAVVDTSVTLPNNTPNTVLEYNLKKHYEAMVDAGIASLSDDFKIKVDWTECTHIAPPLTITITPLSNFDLGLAATNIIKAVAAYANKLDIMKDIEPSAILQEILYADPGFQGRATYYCVPNDILIEDLDSQTEVAFVTKPTGNTSAIARHTYYYYSDNVVRISDSKYQNASNNQTITVQILSNV